MNQPFLSYTILYGWPAFWLYALCLIIVCFKKMPVHSVSIILAGLMIFVSLLAQSAIVFILGNVWALVSVVIIASFPTVKSELPGWVRVLGFAFIPVALVTGIGFYQVLQAFGY
ncbi:hypothetical protein [Ruegeria arenilitoris]|uniref:hypothetical protein n=1 Tax=Ruegeria arenilitoris TaxID=1173585 RepID=UPI00147B2E7B|nr:hypothetical protein [Ruegeria arenilitoris]